MFIRVLALKDDPLRVIEAAVPATRLNPADESIGLQLARCLSLRRDVCSSTLEDKNLKSWRVDPRVRCCVGKAIESKTTQHKAIRKAKNIPPFISLTLSISFEAAISDSVYF